MKTRAMKIEYVKTMSSDIKNAKVIALANFEGLPSPQFQEIRKSIRDSATITVVKNSVLRKIIENLKEEKKGIESLNGYVKGQIALIVSKENSFVLTRYLEQSKKKAPAKGGEIAAEDISVHEGETSFKPGPIVGEMQKLGIPSAIDKGKVVIKKDALVVKKGSVISKEMGDMLARLSIFPITVGFDIKAAWEDNFVFNKDMLKVNSELVYSQIGDAVRNAQALAMDIEYMTDTTRDLIISTAVRKAFVLSVELSYTTKDNLPYMLQKAQAISKKVDEVVSKNSV